MARVKPSNLEAEMSVLGVAFIAPDLVSKICESVSEDMFYDERNRYVFNAIKSLYESKTPVDITTVKNELDKNKTLSTVKLEHISDIIDSVVTSANIDYYIQMLLDSYTRRILIDTSEDIIREAYDDKDVATLQESAERKILFAVRNRRTGDLLSIQEALREAHDKLEQLAKNKRLVTGLETGFYDLDKITTGFQGGEMIILAARPGMGKTALALNMATYAATTTKKAIAIFNLEMSADMLVNRMISSMGRVESYKLQTGNMQERDWQRYNEAMDRLAKTNIYIEADSAATISEIRAKCRRLATSETGLGLVIIDYLQLVNSGDKKTESRQVEVSDISRSLKTMALELNVPVLALSQLSRTAEKRESNQPILSDLRESGSLEQDADMVLFINRKDYYEPKKDQRETIVPAELVIAKHRKGSLGTIDLMFELSIGSFKSVVKDFNKDE